MTKSKPSDEQRRVFSEMGKKGGSKGGKAAAANMTKQQRVARAKKAAAASIAAKKRDKARWTRAIIRLIKAAEKRKLTELEYRELEALVYRRNTTKESK